MSITARRLYGPSVLAGLAVGGFAFFAAGRVWGTTQVLASGLPSDTVTVTGTEALPVVSALALVIVAGSIAVLATSARLRRIVGAVLVITGLVGAVLAFRYDGPVLDALGTAVNESPAFTGNNTPDVHGMTSWPIIAAVAFVLAAILGVLVVTYGLRWPTMGRKYDSPSARTSAESPESESDLWKALDEGRDPTQ